MKPTFTNDSATISTTEYSLPADSTSLAAQTDDCVLEGWIDFANMVAGDSYEVKLYEKINGGTARVTWHSTLVGAQATPLVVPQRILGEGWDLTVKRLAGSDRSIAWSLRKLIEGETVVAGSLSAGAITAAAIATGAIDADAIATDAVTEIQSGLALSTQVDALEAAVIAIEADTQDIQGRLPAALVGGKIDAIADVALGANSITASVLAADAVAEIQSGLALSTQVDALEAAAIAIEADTQDIQGRLPAALVSGRIDASVGAMAANVMTAAALAADAGTEIAAAVWATVLSGSRTAKGMLRRAHAMLVYKTSGMHEAGTGRAYDEDGTTVLVAAVHDPDAGTRATPTTIAGD